MIAGHWYGWVILIFVWSTFFHMNMYLKEKLSYEKKEGWDTYKKNSYMLLPKIFGSDLLNIVIYWILLIIFVHFEWKYIFGSSPIGWIQ